MTKLRFFFLLLLLREIYHSVPLGRRWWANFCKAIFRLPDDVAAKFIG